VKNSHTGTSNARPLSAVIGEGHLQLHQKERSFRVTRMRESSTSGSEGSNALADPPSSSITSLASAIARS
jgi:hypothetical protein